MSITNRRDLGAATEELVVPGDFTVIGGLTLQTTDTTAADPTSDAPDILFQVKGADGSLYVIPGYDAT